MAWGSKKVVKAISKEGDPTPPGYCACGRTTKRSGLGTCGRQGCIQKLQAKALGKEVAAKDGRDPAAGAKVKVDGKGSAKTVKYTKSVRGTDCVVLDDGTTVPMDRVKFQ